jgi:hypothetical protein
VTTQAPSGEALLIHSVDLSHRFAEDNSLSYRRDDGQGIYRCIRCDLIAVKIRATGMLRRSEPSGPCEGAASAPLPAAIRPIEVAATAFREIEVQCDGNRHAQRAISWLRNERERHLAMIARYEAELFAWEKATGRSTP